MKIQNERVNNVNDFVDAPSVSAAAGTTTTGAALLPDASCGTAMVGLDAGATFAMLAVKSGQDEETIHDTLRKSEEATQEGAEKQEIQALHDAASSTLTGGLVSGAFSVAEGLNSLDTTIRCDGASKEDADLTQGLGKAEEAFLKGGAAASDGVFQAQAQNHKADSESYRASAEDASRRAADQKDASDGAKKYVDFAIDFLKQWNESKAAIAQATVVRG